MKPTIYPQFGQKIEKWPDTSPGVVDFGGKFGRVKTVRRACTLGGFQRYFVCPRCDRRCRVLHPLITFFHGFVGLRCHKCAGNYQSSQTHKMSHENGVRAAAIARKIDPYTGKDTPAWVQVVALLPPWLLYRPRYMHEKKYERLRAQYEQVCREIEAAHDATIRNLEKMLGRILKESSD